MVPDVANCQTGILSRRNAARMARSKSSKRWLAEHFDDHYVKLAQLKGLRSRAAFKLLELHEKYHLIHAGMTVVDLGEFIQGDFTEDDALQELESVLAGREIDLVLSDMAPNITGMAVTDQAKAMYLAELALEFVKSHLKPGGNFVVKLFQGEDFDAYVKEARQHFVKVQVRKPKASRPRSREVYLLARERQVK
jgi:23S rRNA (uridine2552-2'-O)-methyltransferase